ncbi:MAG: HEAT repeat domain-containing protein, partial [Xenococcus sp. (in: cyanobacteria)]
MKLNEFVSWLTVVQQLDINEFDSALTSNLIRKLPELGSIRAIDLLTKLFLECEDRSLNEFAKNTLKRIDCYPDTTINLIFQLNSVESKIRCRAAKILGQKREFKALVPLIQALDDEESDVKLEVIKALENIGDIKAIEGLRQAVQDYDRNVSQTAKNALKKLSNPQTLE